MTYVQRLPHLPLPTVSLSGRGFALLLVGALHILLIGLIVEQLRTIDGPVSTVPPPVVLLPESRNSPPPDDPLNDLRPATESVRIVSDIPDFEIERRDHANPVPLDPNPLTPDSGAGRVPDTHPFVVTEPRQDAHHPLSRPAYPPTSIRLGETGVVVLDICLNESGQPTRVQIRSSSGFPRLDQAALSHLQRRSVRFLPGTANGQPVSMCTDLRIRFGFDP